MDERDHLSDPTPADDTELVASVRRGDRLAFGLLYLRHHAAAWRVACSVTGFSDDAEVALLEGFTAVFATLPREFVPPQAFRPYLLACVRQAALGRPSRPAGAGTPPSDINPGDVVLDDDVVLSGLEHHLVHDALRRLPESRRTALWLTDVEAMTPREVAAVLDLDVAVVPGLVAEARASVRSACADAQRRGPVRAGCRFSVDRLEPYLDGRLTRPERLHVNGHLDRCVTCRMRRSELARPTVGLAASVPAVPLLAGEAQRQWLERSRPAAGARPTVPPARPTAASLHPALRRRTSLAPIAVSTFLLAAALGLPRLGLAGSDREPSDPSAASQGPVAGGAGAPEAQAGAVEVALPPPPAATTEVSTPPPAAPPPRARSTRPARPDTVATPVLLPTVPIEPVSIQPVSIQLVPVSPVSIAPEPAPAPAGPEPVPPAAVEPPASTVDPNAKPDDKQPDDKQPRRSPRSRARGSGPAQTVEWAEPPGGGRGHQA